MSERAVVRFEPSGRTVSVPLGWTLLEAARAAGVEIDAPCGGSGSCGSCRVRATGALSVATQSEQELLGRAGIALSKRLACRARIEGDVTVLLPEQPREVRVAMAAQHRAVEVQPPTERGIDRPGELIGTAFDIGTTTIAGELVDLRTGAVLAASGELNAQRTMGTDVLSRVAHASGGGAMELRDRVVKQLDAMTLGMLEQTSSAPKTLTESVVVGNVAMTGLFLGADVSPLGEAPYEGAPLGGRRVRPVDIGSALHQSLEIIVLPAASAFVGSDVTAGMLATSLAERITATLYIDLGTNGEIVLAAKGELRAATAAAGPALEGASIQCGMRAEAGAIEQVEIEGDSVLMGVIGECKPQGICGSGLLDLIAALLDAGVIDASGRLLDTVGHPLRMRITEREGSRAFIVDEHNDIVLTQQDIRQVQLAIGAIRAAIELLLASAGLEPTAIVTVVIAGGFGFHVRAASLVRLGLLHPLWLDRVTFAGNTALVGARMALLSGVVRESAEDIVSRVQTVDLAAHPEFQQRFIGSLTFPG
ncbi:MAG: ASKHA domain-containing protein [Coriobacteriia bacterium]|nr:ASKHA domain-containing protein [Coriobacteriia bacterium]